MLQAAANRASDRLGRARALHEALLRSAAGSFGSLFGAATAVGFGIRRLRERRLTTLPEYFQQRYSRNVRVTAGIICALAGILNMGLFPKMGATFITYATGLGRVERPADAPTTKGASTIAARKPSTTLGRLAIISMTDLSGDRQRGVRNSLV